MRSTPNAADTRYYHHDGLGSTVAMSNNSGNTVASTRFDAWGNIINATGSTPPFGYTGQVPDATGLIHYRARYYDPTMGRFTQRDPAGFADGINRYAYVGNSPTNFTDPLGLGRQAVTVGSGVRSTYAGNTPNSNNPNSLPAINSGCGGRVGMCHTSDQNISPPQLYNQTVDWWNENRSGIGQAAADIETVFSTGAVAAGLAAQPEIAFPAAAIAFGARGVQWIATPPTPNQQGAYLLDNIISNSIPNSGIRAAYDLASPAQTVEGLANQ